MKHTYETCAIKGICYLEHSNLYDYFGGWV